MFTFFHFTPAHQAQFNNPKNAAGTSSQQRYQATIRLVDEFISREMADKNLPGVSIALVDDQQIIWQQSYGFADPSKKTPITSDTIFRVGSVSKLFTDIALMRLVEPGKLDLDVPVTEYLPDFKPRNQFKKQIPLRQLMSHRSGLVRKPPIGNYFDSSRRTLRETIKSLNQTAVVYEPGTRTKYSNAGIADVTKVFWEATPDDKKLFVADPADGSRHNRGAAVDLTLYDLKTGNPVEMVSTYDETTDRAYPNYSGGTSLQRWYRELLRDAMESENFTVYEAEWRHFDYKNWRNYRIGN